MRKLEIGPNLEMGPIDDTWETMNVMGKSTFVWDLRKLPLPFPDNTYDLIYMSHILEHIPWFRTVPTLKELRRILVPGGIIEIWVPDIDKLIAAYHDDKLIDKDRNKWHYNKEKNPMKWFNARVFSCITNTTGEENWHRACFNKKHLIDCLLAAGFTEIIGLQKPRGYDHGWINLGIGGRKND